MHFSQLFLLQFSLMWNACRLAKGAQMLSPLADIGDMLVNSSISIVADTQPFGGPSNIVRALAHLPAPEALAKKRQIDPRVAIEGSCDRDYQVPCPLKFVNIGTVKQGVGEHCVAGSMYTGPCQSEAYAFAGLSHRAKARWSEMCMAQWPCKGCERNFQEPCPQGWERVGDTKCAPSPAYSGPCRGTVDFKSYNKHMLEAWSSECEAFWSCEMEAGFEGTQSLRRVGFLAAKTIPVDALKIRNGFYLTQPLRTPAQSSVNVIVHEDLPQMKTESKYRGIEEQATRLHKQIEDTLVQMKG